jgi:hypothetical protein
MMMLREICCDSCPFSPTCEEENEFLRDIGQADDQWGEVRGFRVPGPDFMWKLTVEQSGRFFFPPRARVYGEVSESRWPDVRADVDPSAQQEAFTCSAAHYRTTAGMLKSP